MPYAIELHPRAIINLSRLDPAIVRPVRDKLDELASNAEGVQHRALTGQLRGLFRLRVGDYRVLYTLDRENRRIVVRAVRHRSEAY